MSFQFIDNAAINYGSRKLIRSHVMKGKNLGRKLTRSTNSSKQAPAQPVVVDLGSPDTDTTASLATSDTFFYNCGYGAEF